jgi:hypothetical protein
LAKHEKWGSIFTTHKDDAKWEKKLYMSKLPFSYDASLSPLTDGKEGLFLQEFVKQSSKFIYPPPNIDSGM